MTPNVTHGYKNIRKEEGKKGKKGVNSSQKIFSFPDDHPGWPIARGLHESLVSSGVLNGTKIDLNTWVNELDKIHRIDGFSWDDIRKVCEWYPTDKVDPPRGSWDGWWDKARSPMKFRVKRDGETKFEKLIASYNQAQALKATQKPRSLAEIKRAELDALRAAGGDDPRLDDLVIRLEMQR